MTLEIRQLLLKSTVGDTAGERAGAGTSTSTSAGIGADAEGREQLKDEILAECRRMLLEQFQQLKER